MTLERHHLCGQGIVAGLDEAGRGCLAGPVTAAVVILPDGLTHPDLNDSKKLSENRRNQLRKIIEDQASAWAVAFVSPQRIDEINILWASVEAMHQALDLLRIRPDHLIIDGNRFRKYKDIPHECIVKGDARFYSIAAASILAKTHRDEYMNEQDQLYPVYGWKNNKGYPTKSHRNGIADHGVSPLHRLSFRLMPEKTPTLF